MTRSGQIISLLPPPPPSKKAPVFYSLLVGKWSEWRRDREISLYLWGGRREAGGGGTITFRKLHLVSSFVSSRLLERFLRPPSSSNLIIAPWRRHSVWQKIRIPKLKKSTSSNVFKIYLVFIFLKKNVFFHLLLFWRAYCCCSGGLLSGFRHVIILSSLGEEDVENWDGSWEENRIFWDFSRPLKGASCFLTSSPRNQKEKEISPLERMSKAGNGNVSKSRESKRPTKQQNSSSDP